MKSKKKKKEKKYLINKGKQISTFVDPFAEYRLLDNSKTGYQIEFYK